jgi:TRAP-type C4-dicarboxylate transport system substrate-binding protein
MRKYFRCLSGCGLLLLAVGMATPALAGPAKIKVALVTPEGSTWVKVLREMAADVKTRTAGEVDFLIYAGGVSGDEIDVLRKMRINRIQAAGFSGVGLGVVLPEVRVLEAPLLFQNDEEVDAVREQMFAYFAQALSKKGFVLLGFTEGGWVYLFSQKDLSKPAALASIKMWVWEGDRVAETFLHNFGIRTTPLHIAEVNTGLERHMIDSFYSPAMAAVAFQWYAHMGYVLDFPMANSTAALVMTKRAFGALPAEHQAIVKDSARKYCRKLVELTRDDNRKAIEVMKAQGIRFVSPTNDQLKTFQEDAQKTYRQSIPHLYSQTLFERIQAIVHASRGSTRPK